MKVEKEVTVHVVDVNDNPPHLKASRAFICANDKKPVLLVAEDKDAEPFAGPFTFSLGFKRSNWELKQVDGEGLLLQPLCTEPPL